MRQFIGLICLTLSTFSVLSISQISQFHQFRQKTAILLRENRPLVEKIKRMVLQSIKMHLIEIN